jgi:cytoskeleton protein RodZ
MGTEALAVSGEDAGGDGSAVGALLRANRLKAGYDLGELSRQLRIRRTFLEAIEDGRFRDLPGHTYAIGFVKAYAEYFGLDAAEIVRRFRNEAGERGATQSLNFPAPVAERGTPRGAVILIGLIIAAVAYGAWYINTVRDNALVELVSPVPERLRHLIEGATGGGEAGGGAPSAPAAAPDTPVVVVPVPPREQPLSPTIATPPPAEAAAPPPPQAAAPPPPAAEPSPPPPATTAPVTAPSAAATGGRVVLRARADSWVQIRDPATRTALLARILKAGESFEVPDRPGLLMTVGNAGGLEVLIDGETMAPLGRDGTVRRNVPLDIEPLRQGLAGGN